MFWNLLKRFFVSRFDARVISRGSQVIDELRKDVSRNINVLLMQLNSSHHARAVLEKGVWSYITKNSVYEWRFSLVGDKVVASCRLNYGVWVFSSCEKKEIPLYEVMGVHKSLTELNKAMTCFGGMNNYLDVFAKATCYAG